MKKELIKVAMADDHILLRNALAALINNSGECTVIFECSSGNDLILGPKKFEKLYRSSSWLYAIKMFDRGGNESRTH
jgi:hypothetical protein